MTEYIEREAILREIERRESLMVGDKLVSVDAMKSFIKNRPAADVAPVRHGRWVHENMSEGYAWVMCSECEAVIHKILINKRLNYCPNCGAKMDAGDGNSDICSKTI